MTSFRRFSVTAALLCAGLFAASNGVAQYFTFSENFETGGGGFPGNGGVYSAYNAFSWGSASTCGGSAGAVSQEIQGSGSYSSATLSFPYVGTSTGGSTTVSFSYAVLYTGNTPLYPTIGTIKVDYYKPSTASWVTVLTINNSNHVQSTSCATVTTPAFMPPAGPLQLRIVAAMPTTGYLYNENIVIDNIVVQEASGPACTGVPVGGTTVSTDSQQCSGKTSRLSVTPAVNNAGLLYQWQSSPNGTTWTDIAGATAYEYTKTQTVSMYYRRKTTCSASGQVAYSTTLSQPMSTTPFFCCTAQPAQVGVLQIGNVTLGTLSNSSSCYSLGGSQGNATGDAGRYANYTSSTAPVPSVPRGTAQPFSVSVSNCPQYGYYYSVTAIYVDFNQDGDFDDAGEKAYSGTFAQVTSSGRTETGYLTIPAGASLGQTRMRVFDIQHPAYQVTCGTYQDMGEVEDYTINIIDGPGCTGTPVAPVATGPASNCPNQAFSLAATNFGYIGVTGLAYQWQSSPAGTNTWANLNLPGDTARTGVSLPNGQVASRDYRLKVTCTNTGLVAYSNVVAVTTPAPSACYCASATTSATACQRWISSVATTGAVTNMTNSSACTPNGWANYTTSVTGPSQYQDYPLKLNLTTGGGPAAWTIYVDYNNDAAFTSDELVYYNANAAKALTVTDSFVIPLTAPLGLHRMRIRADSGATASNAACSATASGETEDYMLTVLLKPSCTGTPASATITTTQPYIYCTSFPDKPITLSGGTNTGTSGVSGITTAWERSNDSNFSTLLAQYSSTIGQNASGFYRAKQTCTTSGQSAYSNTILVSNQMPGLVITPATAAFCAGSGGVMLTANVGVGVGSPTPVYTWISSGGTCNNCISCTNCSNPIVSPTASSSFTVTVTVGSCPSIPASRTVSVLPQPTVLAAVAPGAVCAGQAISLSSVTDTLGTYTGFAGPFAPAQWAFSQAYSNGKLDVSGAPNAVVFTSSDSTAISSYDASDSWSITIPRAGNVSFSWTYSTVDSAANDFVRYSANGTTFSDLPGYSRTGSKNQSGTAVIPVAAGAAFILRDRSLNNSGGSATTTISNFSAPGGLASTVNWYDAPTGGTLVANPASVIPSGSGPVTYYAEAVATAAGCVSKQRLPSNAVRIRGTGEWTGAVDSNWTTAGNWCGGVPTATSNLVIPGALTVPNVPVLSTAGSANTILLQAGSSLNVSGTGTLNLYGALTGTGVLNAGTATVNFAGVTPQTVPAGMTVGTLSVNGGSVKTLAGALRVNTALNLVDGMVDAGGNTLTLAPAATVTGASSTRYVRTSAPGGRLRQQVGTTPVVFPVGNAAYNPATLTNTGTADTFAVGVRDAVLLGGTTGAPVSAIYGRVVNHTWDVEESTTGGSNVTLKLQWNAGEVNTTLFDYNHVQVAHYTGGSYTLDPSYPTQSAAPAAGGYPGGGPYTAIRSGLTSFSPFTVSSSAIGSTPLPVTLLSIRARNEGTRNKIEWEVQDEADGSTYAVDRSVDGAHFMSLQAPAVQGVAGSYASYDEQPNPDLTYYRLTMKAPDGSTTHSQTVSAFLKSGNAVEMTVQPNPARDRVTVTVYGASGGRVAVTDVSGRVLATTALTGNEAQVDLTALAPGTYFFRYTSDVFNRTVSLTKE